MTFPNGSKKLGIKEEKVFNKYRKKINYLIDVIRIHNNKLFEDFTEILKKDLITHGFTVESNWSPDDLFFAHFNYSRRLVLTKIRNIHYSKEFNRPTDPDLKNGLELLENKFENGASVNPHLSRDIAKRSILKNR